MERSFKNHLKSSFAVSIAITIFAISLFSCDSSSSKQENVNVKADHAFPAADADNGGLTLPENFGAIAVTDSIGRARHIAINNQGDIFVKMRTLADEKGVLYLKDSSGNGKLDLISGFGDFGGTGIAIYKDFLYCSSDSAVYRYKMENGIVKPNTLPDTIVTGFIVQRTHASKPIAFDGNGNMYVTIGAPSNACQESPRTPGSKGHDPCSQLDFQAGIWQFKAEKFNQTLKDDGHRYATGIRNAVAIDWNFKDNALYALQHGRDQLSHLFPEYYTQEQSAELPAEEFLKIADGDDFGWPYCYYDQFQEKKILAPEYGGDGQKIERCEGITPPILAFPGHWAPNDLLFYTGDQFPEKYKNGAFIAFHGSWNRAPFPQQGYFVAFVPFKDGKPEKEWERFAEGFTQVDSVMSTNDAKFRPVGLAEGPDGSLFISDSAKGKIWRVIYYGNKLALKD
ncbi:PQQ-dependent sugar dehydrogenase [Flexithrix dorotheae]|uniref:PQQ-dependent sugar dehydrogenase n=1 Tax=Flexithrix dorotheae TaxID=70993 RepID=UPI0003712DCD|nr:PQQ-dependent sugar dehydrogenase [Flexithrix dorotheae]